MPLFHWLCCDRHEQSIGVVDCSSSFERGEASSVGVNRQRPSVILSGETRIPRYRLQRMLPGSRRLACDGGGRHYLLFLGVLGHFRVG